LGTIHPTAWAAEATSEGWRFHSNEEVQMAVCEGWRMQQSDFCCDEIIKFMPKRYKCIKMLRDYAAK
jgi:hypothetical protein